MTEIYAGPQMTLLQFIWQRLARTVLVLVSVVTVIFVVVRVLLARHIRLNLLGESVVLASLLAASTIRI